jgi:olefin beta-lactone synthetase
MASRPATSTVRTSADVRPLQTGERLDCFTQLYTGGAPVFPDLLDRLRRFAPQAKLVAVYGSTEAEPIAHVTREEITEADAEAMRKGAGLLAGRCVEQIDLRIIGAAP